MGQTNDIKQSLVDDLLNESDLIEYVIPYSVTPEQLDERDGFEDHAICIFEGISRSNVTTDASFPYQKVQEYLIMVYARSERLKGSEGKFEGFFDNLNDEIWQWIESLSVGNRLYTVTNEQLRVPNSRDTVTTLFEDREEPIQLGKSTYTRFRIQTIRKAQTNGSQ